LNNNLNVHIGGSNRKLEKQMKAFKEAEIPLTVSCGTGHGHHSNSYAWMPDTAEARALLKKVGGTVCRRQWKDSSDLLMPKMF
jgi:hypothetical protein